jgi:hypothetical protein
MRDRTATPNGDRRGIEAAAVTDHTSLQQIRHWVMAHRLEVWRVCTGFRIDELGLGEVIASQNSDGSGPWLASAGTWRR